jgi:predicted site-specific integrase-resolvase
MHSIINEKQSVRLFSKKQAAAEFGVCYRTIERWLQTGYIDSIRIGGRIYICYSEIYRIRDRFLETKPNVSHKESRIRTLDDIHRRYEQLPYSNLSGRQ